MFDLESISARCEGEALIQRLVFMSQSQPAARALLVETLQEARNTAYPGDMDAEWTRKTLISNKQARDALQSRLTSAQAHLHKEAIRSAYIALAQHDYQRGELTEAFQSLLRAKDYGTTHKQNTEVSLLLIEIALFAKNYSAVREFVHKLHHNTTSDPDTLGKVNLISGLEKLAHKDFAGAYECLRQATGDPRVLSVRDMQLYTAILCLATGSRSSMVELTEQAESTLPTSMRTCLQLFSRANFAGSLSIWERDFAPSLRATDPLISYLLPELGSELREKAIILYWKPYSRLDLAQMATELGMDLAALTTLLEDLIGKRPELRLTRLEPGLLVRDPPPTDQQQLLELQAKLQAQVTQVMDDSYSMLIRLGCLEHMGGQSGKNKDIFGLQMPTRLARMSDDDDSDMGEAKVDAEEMDMDADVVMENPEDLY